MSKQVKRVEYGYDTIAGLVGCGAESVRVDFHRRDIDIEDLGAVSWYIVRKRMERMERGEKKISNT